MTPTSLSKPPSTPPPRSPRSRLVLLRQPVKSVRAPGVEEQMPGRLWLGVLVAVGVLVGVWLVGHLGWRLGFAPIVRVPELSPQTGGGLATGTIVLTAIPRVIFAAGLAAPMWLMLAFLMIAIPAASLGAARPTTPGGPRMKQSLAILASGGAVVAMISGSLLIWWTGSGARLDLLRVLPTDPTAMEAWHADLQTVAGLDVLAVVAAALWVVLVMRLPVARWLRALAASAAFFTLAVATVAMSISGAAAAHAGAKRPLCVLDDGAGTPRLVLGATPHHLATMVIYDDGAVVELRNYPDAFPITGRESIVEYAAGPR